MDDMKSTSGFYVYLGPNMLSWASKKQLAISRSSCEVENKSLASLVAELFRIRSLLTKLQVPMAFVPMVYYDNLSVVLTVANLVLNSTSEHFELDLHFVRDHASCSCRGC